MASFKQLGFYVVEFLVSFLALLSTSLAHNFDYEFVTCGSVIKLQNAQHRIRLHSHDVKYGTGSGQQSVTGVEGSDDHNSYWQVRAKTGAACSRGVPIKCGQTLRLTHLSTKRNLHSHHFNSPLSHNLEVSAFGESGEGDEGDNWVVVCAGKYWSRDQKFRLKNVVTEHYLHVAGESYGRPIHGQFEISGYPHPSDLNYWHTAEGIYIKPAEDPLQNIRAHDEL